MTREPIRIPCEGSDHKPALWAKLKGADLQLCAMCGRLYPVHRGRVIPHMRDDVLAMIDRGDYDEAAQ